MSRTAVLAYSGGLDTSCAIAWLKEDYGFDDVVAVLVDVGQDARFAPAVERATVAGADDVILVDRKEAFADDQVAKALLANALYEGRYPLVSSLSRPVIAGAVAEIALELGAEARDLDALQYHPNGGAWPPNMQGYSIPETTRAYGAVLLNRDMEEFTDSLGPRDEVSQAIFDEVAAGRGVETLDGRPAVYLDTTRIPEADAEVSLPYMLRRYRAAGVDPLSEPILTYPVLHYQNGGLIIDEHGETTLEGVYACGEIAGGTHGRNRMMGNSLLECCVFGRRAGRAAAERARA